MKTGEERELESQTSDNQEMVDRQSLLELFTHKADKDAKTYHQKKLAREKEIVELHGGKKTSIFEETEKLRRIIMDTPQNHEPKFRQFFAILGDLAGWTEEEKKAYHKPPIAAKTINEVIYNRFPKGVILHINTKNPYIKWCTREHKNYLFLSDNGILLLEIFIDDAVNVMLESSTVYEFRMKHAEKFGMGFQLGLYEEYLSKATPFS